MKKTIDSGDYEKLVEQIHYENPKIDIEFCKYIAGAYLFNDVEKSIVDLEDQA